MYNAKKAISFSPTESEFNLPLQSFPRTITLLILQSSSFECFYLYLGFSQFQTEFFHHDISFKYTNVNILANFLNA